MTQIWPGRRAALGGAALCALTLVGAWSDPPAWSTKQKPLPVVAAVAQAQPNVTSVAIPNQTATSAGAKEVTASARRRLPTTPRTTSTTVMGGGNPSTWPAGAGEGAEPCRRLQPQLENGLLGSGAVLRLVGFTPQSEACQELRASDFQHLPCPRVLDASNGSRADGTYRQRRPKSTLSKSSHPL